MIRINKKQYTDARKRIRTFIKKNHRLPNYCEFVKNDGGKVDLSKEEFCGLFQGYMQFCLKHNREPNYLTLNHKANLPLVLNYQDDKVSCSPASFLMCMMFLFEYKSEAAVKKVFGTTVNGTSPPKMVEGARKLGYKVTPMQRDFRKVKEALNSYCPVMMHIQTKPAKCLGYLNDYGHWIMCYKVGSNVYYIADPTKGFKKCNMNDINKATEGRKIFYYKVEIL